MSRIIPKLPARWVGLFVPILLCAAAICALAASPAAKTRRILYNLDGDSCMTLKVGRMFNFFTAREWAEPVEPPFEVLAQIGDAKALSASANAGAVPLLAWQVTSPLDYQVVQRTRRESGTILIAGTLTAGAALGDVLEARLGSEAVNGRWRTLTTLARDQSAFRSEWNATAGGWHRLVLRVRRGQIVLTETNIAHVGVGEVFVIAGQSNSANHGEEKQSVKSGLVTSFSGRQWQIANDPQPGASGGGGSFVPPFADALAERFKVPIGIVAIGSGGTSVREWLPRGTRFPNPPTVTNNVIGLASGEWESKGKLFDSLIGQIKPLGSRGFRALLWHQGESDANQDDPSRTLSGELYQKFLEQLIRESRREAGWEFPWFVAQASYHTPDDPGSPEIRAAQQALWRSAVALEGPDTDALTGALRDGQGQGVHFSGPGLREHGRLWVEKVSPWLEQQLGR
ncbi:MAG: sialate O-acetylesterase [Verrucomicrobiota bacterium]